LAGYGWGNFLLDMPKRHRLGFAVVSMNCQGLDLHLPSHFDLQAQNKEELSFAS